MGVFERFKDSPLFSTMEYKEIKKKNGQRIVFCNFEELLKEFYGVKTMEEVETKLGPNGEYIIHCPFCKEEGHRKHKLYIKGDLTVGHCFVCTRNYVNVTDRIDTTIKFPEFISRFINFSGMPEIVKLTDPDWSIDNIEQDLVDYDKKGVDYLIGRHPLMEELYKVLDFKFLDGNVVMPFKYHGEVFYYQIRFTEGKIRYFFPPISAKPPYIIEHGDNSKFIICEGVFDAISLLIQAPDYTPCAVLGSSVSDYQIEFIREYAPKEILVYMDETDISKRIASKLSKSIDYCPINIIPSNGEDPEECMIRKMKEGKELSWIKPKENLGRKNLSWEYKNPMIR